MHGIRRCYLAPTLFALFATLWQPSCLAADEAIVSRIEAMEAGFPVQVLGNRLMAHQALSAFYGANARWNPFCGMRWSARTSPAHWIRCGHPIPPTES